YSVKSQQKRATFIIQPAEQRCVLRHKLRNSIRLAAASVVSFQLTDTHRQVTHTGRLSTPASYPHVAGDTHWQVITTSGR
ncbi:MAG: hypothetical protein KDA92_26165, partial [Planctomycetales bacterium]|nr:hypothetical protein [Planctomycetales bacterium]